MKIESAGVIGAGLMGAGVAQCLSEAGISVVLTDVTDEALEGAKKRIREGVRMAMFFDRKKERPSADEVLSRIETTTDLSRLSGADFVIENATEDFAIKEAIYRAIDPICPPHCVFAANTSAILITRLASYTTRPDRVLGMHFMNPVPMKEAVEVIRGHLTSDATIEAALGLLASMKKRGIVVGDAPGFVSNRVLMLTVNEAIWTVHDGVATAEQVDDVFVSCFGHKMGPLHTADLIGLDTILRSLEVLLAQTGDPKFRPCPLLVKMVCAGQHGKKTGKGFFGA